MQEIIISLMDKFGYFGIMFLIAIENIFPPIPSEVILTFGGFVTTQSKLTVVGVIIFATIGSILGAVALYYIGKILNKERLEKIVASKLGRILCLKKQDIEKADKWFDKQGPKAVFFARFIPIVRSLISIPAGMSEMPFLKFLLLTSIGTAIWNIVLVSLGVAMGENWEIIANIIDKYAKVVLVLIVIVGIILVAWFYKGRLSKNKKEESN